MRNFLFLILITNFSLGALVAVVHATQVGVTSTPAFELQKSIRNRDLLLRTFSKKGVPAAPLKEALDYLSVSYGKAWEFYLGREWHRPQLKNARHLVIVDYSQSSLEKRFYLLDLEKGQLQKHYVAHGLNTGGNKTYRFSNQPESLQSSLGFYLTGAPYEGKFGPSLKLYGLQASNSRAFERYVVLHGAHYVSEKFIQRYGYLGRSHGCLTLEKDVATLITPFIQDGTLIYVYHSQLSKIARTEPENQVLLKRNPAKDNPVPTQVEREQSDDNPFAFRLTSPDPLSFLTGN